MDTKFTKVTDRKGTSIFEGTVKGKEFSIKRFICDVGQQETEEETQKLADQIVDALTIFGEKQKK